MFGFLGVPPLLRNSEKIASPIFTPARGAEVISSNIVGYNKITLHPGMNMIGGLFQGVGTGEALSLNGQFANDATVSTAGGGADEADTIMTFDALTQNYNPAYYFYYEDGGSEEENNKWIDPFTDEPTDDSVSEGSGGWYRNRSSSTIQLQMTGEVPTNRTYQVTLYPGMNFVVNPYPAPIAMNGTSFTVTGVTAGGGADEADTIMTFNASTQNYNPAYYFYYEDGGSDEENNKWIDPFTDEPTDDTLDPGIGFWYRYRGTGTATLTFAKPY